MWFRMYNSDAWLLSRRLKRDAEVSKYLPPATNPPAQCLHCEQFYYAKNVAQKYINNYTWNFILLNSEHSNIVNKLSTVYSQYTHCKYIRLLNILQLLLINNLRKTYEQIKRVWIMKYICVITHTNVYLIYAFPLYRK